MVRHNGIEIDRHRRLIHHDGKYLSVSPRRFDLIAVMVLAGAKTTEELFDILYAHRRDGGPLYGPALIKILFSQLKPVVRRVGLEIVTFRSSGLNRNQYMIVPIGSRPAHWRIYGNEKISAIVHARWAARR